MAFSPSALLLAGIKVFFDVAKMIPGLSGILGLEPVIVDGISLGVLVEQDAMALMATPEWAKFLASAKTFLESKGAKITLSTTPANPVSTAFAAVVTSYVTPPNWPKTPAEFNLWQSEHPAS